MIDEDTDHLLAAAPIGPGGASLRAFVVREASCHIG